ncbi:MAG: enoyl-CoA hydratase/isomerase family protein [Afipia sp.]|nr:enoyl-CoA hydratase/isomerase family protein [Afipia sp.]OJW63995.1 MAG: hypothetical protein BGO65_05130 [Afipia sp. 64-13]
MTGQDVANTQVRFSRQGDVAVITIDNPPINAGSHAVRYGLLACLAEVEADAALIGAVLIGAGKTFITGSDLREFDKPIEEPQLPTVISAIEQGAKPVVAALHGAALGGGYELALGCDQRIAAPGTIVGLPEATLGLIPGAGGTQRLPRLTGVPQAIALICSGRRVEAREALALGMIDRVAENDLLETAVAAVRAQAGQGRRRIMDTMPPAADPAAVEAAAKTALKAGKHRPHVLEAIAAIKASAHLPPADALAQERATFQRLRVGREAFALRHLFFAERAAQQPAFAVEGKPRRLDRPAVIGAGTMGIGIAIAMLEAGLPVRLVDPDAAAIERAGKRVAAYYEKNVASSRVSADTAAARRGALTVSDSLEGLEDCDIVIEAVFEDLEVKRDLVRKLAASVRPQTIIATNTSYLSIAAIAEASSHPEHVLGLHFFSPAEIMKLVEVVRYDKADHADLAAVTAFARRLGKLPIQASDSFGFIGNRIYAAYRRQAEFLVEEGAAPEEVDAALEEFGFAMGPFAVTDLSGLDIAWRMRRSQDATRPATERYVTIADRLVELGRLGRKSGAGWYVYREDGKRAPDLLVRTIIDEEVAKTGRIRRQIEASDIVCRCLAAILNEAALIIAEGVCQRASDIDLVLVNGYGFPKHEGGPVFWMSGQPADEIARGQAEIAAAGGSEFRRGDLELLSPDRNSPGRAGKST